MKLRKKIVISVLLGFLFQKNGAIKVSRLPMKQIKKYIHFSNLNKNQHLLVLITYRLFFG